MGFLLKCQGCGYVISSADRRESVEWTANNKSSCRKCQSTQFVISEQPEKNVVIESEDDDRDGDGGQTTLDDH